MARTLLAALLAVAGAVLTIPILVPAAAIAGVRRLAAAIANRIEPDHVTWRELLEFDPEIGWKPKPNMDLHAVTIRDPEIFHVVTDEDGWPGRLPLDDSDVVVFGDSIAFGYAIDHARSFTSLLPEVRVKGIGAPGYNLPQELLLMRRYASRLAGKLVVWLVYYGNDLYDNTAPEMNAYRTPFAGRSGQARDWTIASRHVSAAPWRASRGRHGGPHQGIASALLHKRGAFSDRAFAACEFLIREGQAVCDAAGARLVVLTIPTPRYLSGVRGDSSVPDAALTEICERLGVRVVHGTSILERADYRPTDDHWNANGHRKVAAAISALYDEHRTDTARDRETPLGWRHADGPKVPHGGDSNVVAG